MAIKDILLALTTYPDPTPESSVVDAVAIAAAFDARLAAIACEVKIRLPGTLFGEMLIDLLVMGAYGHARLREVILGGTTDSVLSEPPGYVLMSR